MSIEHEHHHRLGKLRYLIPVLEVGVIALLVLMLPLQAWSDAKKAKAQARKDRKAQRDSSAPKP